MNSQHISFATIAAIPLLSVSPAQWLNYPTPGIPRLADGKPNMSAPAPRATDGKPDLSGVWFIGCLPGTRCGNPNRLLFYESLVGMIFRQVFTDGPLATASDSKHGWDTQWGTGTETRL